MYTNKKREVRLPLASVSWEENPILTVSIFVYNSNPEIVASENIFFFFLLGYECFQTCFKGIGIFILSQVTCPLRKHDNKMTNWKRYIFNSALYQYIDCFQKTVMKSKFVNV